MRFLFLKINVLVQVQYPLVADESQFDCGVSSIQGASVGQVQV